jgi:hypothetical protein
LSPTCSSTSSTRQGVGPVLAITLKGGSSREELVRFKLAP